MNNSRTETKNQVQLCGKATQLFYDGSRVITRRFYCERWDCQRCANFKARQWKSKIINHAVLHHTDYNDYRRVYWYREIDPETYGAIYKRLQRARIEYYAITQGCKVGLLMTKPLSSDDKLLSGSELEDCLNHLLAKEEKPLNGNRKIRCSQQFANHTETKKKRWQAVTVAEDIQKVALEFEKRGCEVSWKNSHEEEFFVNKLTPEAQDAIECLFSPAKAPFDLGARCVLTVLWYTGEE